MDIYCLVKEEQLPVMKYLFGRMSVVLEKVTYFTDPEEYFIAINHRGKKTPDAVLLDFSFYQPEIYNPYIEMKNSKQPVPVCIYNDPFPKENERVAYWLAKNKKYLMPELSESRIDEARDFFYIIQEELLGPEVNPYVSIISRPKVFSKEEMWMENFLSTAHISPSRKKLLSYLFKNRNQDIQKEKICFYLWNDASETHVKNLYTYVHDLRILFRNQSDVFVRFDNDYKSYRMIFNLIEKPAVKEDFNVYNLRLGFDEDTGEILKELL